MMHTIEIPLTTIRNAFNTALSYPATSRGDFFHDVRRAFRYEFAGRLAESGIRAFPDAVLGHTNYRDATLVRMASIIKFTGSRREIRQELDIDFCARYGHDDYSLKAVNYLDRGFCELPSLAPFLRVNTFSLGNVLVLVDNDDYEIELKFENGINLTGYAYQISSRKKKSFICLFGVWFDNKVLSDLAITPDDTCQHERSGLDEIRIGAISYPIIYICRRCGQLFTCSCFQNHFSVRNDVVRLLPYGDSEASLREQVEKIEVKDQICHLCTGGIPKLVHGSDMYYSSFLQKYLPYYVLLSRRRQRDVPLSSEEARQVENELRERFGYPKIGESWISETMLFRVVQMILSPKEVVHHYRGVELRGLELDIWIPDYRIGIEYQGEQHYSVMEHWGGEESLRKRLENDRKKKALCKELGYTLIEFRHDEDMTEETVRTKLALYLQEANKTLSQPPQNNAAPLNITLAE
ncbi:MAG: hypothetical protein ACE5JO_05800 [Candidatus Binatia bacterium]